MNCQADLHSRHLCFNKFLQTRKYIRTLISTSRLIGWGGARVFLTHKQGSNVFALGQLVCHEKVVLWNVLQIGVRKEQ